MSEPIPYSHLEKGTFLIATPEIEEGFYHRGVILLCEHSAAGSFGLLINKPLDAELPEEIIPPGEIHNPNVDLRAGGPVQTNQMMILHTSPTIPDQTVQICQGVYLGGDLPFLQEQMGSEEGSPMRLCFGYSGWQAGQLEREFLDGHWHLCPASSKNIFNVPPDQLWQTLLRQMGGKYAQLSMIPEDLSLN